MKAARAPRNGSRTRRFGPLDVSQVDRLAMTTARRLARQPGRRLRVLDERTVLVENFR
jgi:hypothetical protein